MVLTLVSTLGTEGHEDESSEGDEERRDDAGVGHVDVSVQLVGQ